jgi:hypothetical protein
VFLLWILFPTSYCINNNEWRVDRVKAWQLQRRFGTGQATLPDPC